MNRSDFALTALLRTIKDQLPAYLATLDASRLAQVVCVPGPYNLAAGATVVVREQTFSLTAGASVAASALATAINGASPAGFTASADADGALVFTATAPPALQTPSSVTIGPGTANDVLGITAGYDDKILLALSAPRAIYVPRELEVQDVRSSPMLGLARESLNPVVPLNSDQTRVQLRLHVVFPGPAGERGTSATIEATRAFANAIYRVVEVGDGRGSFLIGRAYSQVDGMQAVVARPLPMQIEPLTLQGLPGGNLNLIPFGQAYPTFEVEVFDQ